MNNKLETKFETAVTVVIPDENDGYSVIYEIYIHDRKGDILAAIEIDNGKTIVQPQRMDEKMANELFQEMRIHQRNQILDNIL